MISDLLEVMIVSFMFYVSSIFYEPPSQEIEIEQEEVYVGQTV